MINKGFLNSKVATDVSKSIGNIQVDVEGLAARMKRLKSNDEGTSAGNHLSKAVRVMNDPNFIWIMMATWLMMVMMLVTPVLLTFPKLLGLTRQV